MADEPVRFRAVAFSKLYACLLREWGHYPIRVGGSPFTDEELDAYLATEHGGAMFQAALKETKA